MFSEPKVGKKVGKKVGEKLTANQQVIVETMLVDNTITAKQLAIKLGISLRKTEENISKLRKMNILKRVGPSKGGYWDVMVGKK